MAFEQKWRILKILKFNMVDFFKIRTILKSFKEKKFKNQKFITFKNGKNIKK